MMAETNKAIAYERRQWCKLSQASGVVGGFIGIVCPPKKKKKKKKKKEEKASVLDQVLRRLIP